VNIRCGLGTCPVVADISSKDSVLLCPAIQRAEYIEHAKRTAIPPAIWEIPRYKSAAQP